MKPVEAPAHVSLGLPSPIPVNAHAALAAAHDRYMYFAGVYTGRPVVDHVAADRTAFAQLLVFTTDGRPSLSEERCAEFMAAITGLPREWCAAWDASAFDATHGEGFADKRARLQDSDALEALDTRPPASRADRDD